MTSQGPRHRRPKGPGGYVIMIRYAPGLWEFHPRVTAEFFSLAEAEMSAAEIPESIERRIYRSTGGRLVRVR